jgi:hypothetical protein
MALRTLREALRRNPADSRDMAARRAMARRAGWACLVPLAVLLPLAPLLAFALLFPWGTVGVLWGAILLVAFMALFSLLPLMAFGAAWLAVRRPASPGRWNAAVVAIVGVLLLAAALASLAGESRPPPPDVRAGPAIPIMALFLGAQAGLLFWGAAPVLARPAERGAA